MKKNITNNSALLSLLALMVTSGCNDVLQEHIIIEDASSDSYINRTSTANINDHNIKPSTTEIFSIEDDNLDVIGNVDEDINQTNSNILSAPIDATNNAPNNQTASNNLASNPAQNEQLNEQLDDAVLALINEANNYQQTGNLVMAVASLERAQRIAPREPYVLYNLAKARLAQKDFVVAEQIATRALFYTNNKPQMQAKLWYLISDCRTLNGDHAGAIDAKEQAKLQNW